MKVMLIKDVYKLGNAGDVKKVANGYGRNYLIPQGLAVLATPGALKQAERIRKEADLHRAALNKEMSGVAEQLKDVQLTFAARAGETGKLYGSVTTRMIAHSIQEKLGIEVDHRQIDSQPLRQIGEHDVPIRLTLDLIPEIKVTVYREGEALVQEESAGDMEADVAEVSMDEATEVEAELVAEVEAEPEASADESESDVIEP